MDAARELLEQLYPITPTTRIIPVAWDVREYAAWSEAGTRRIIVERWRGSDFNAGLEVRAGYSGEADVAVWAGMGAWEGTA